MKSQSQRSVKITVELTEEEATVLCAFAGGVEHNLNTSAGRIVFHFYNQLDRWLPDRELSFGDFFKGRVEPLTEEEVET